MGKMDFFSLAKQMEWAKFLFIFLLYGYTTCGRKTYKDSVCIKLPIKIYFALKKMYEGETFTSVFFFPFFFLPPCSISYAWHIFFSATQLIIGLPVPAASPKAAILFFLCSHVSNNVSY